ncbi:hypothetical protein GCM10027515_20690 [Schumannella luteola]
MTAEAEGRVDEHRAVVVEGGGEQLDAALEQDGDVDLVVCHEISGCDPRA